jgi:hypothetical protein
LLQCRAASIRWSREWDGEQVVDLAESLCTRTGAQNKGCLLTMSRDKVPVRSGEQRGGVLGKGRVIGSLRVGALV